MTSFLNRAQSIQIITVLALAVISSSAFAYPIVSDYCKSDPIKCATEGHLDAIEIYGDIGKSDVDFIKLIDSTVPKDAAFPKIYLDSPGGSLHAAVEIGKILRARKAMVISGSPFMGETYVECSSACVFIAAGATTRQLSHIGIHNGYLSKFNGPKKWSAKDLTQEEMATYFAYLDQMGIDPEVRRVIQETPSKDMADFYFTSSEDRASQKIVQLGFHMFDEPKTPEVKMPVMEYDVARAQNARYVNAIVYGNNEAIHDYVTEILRTPPGIDVDYREANRWLQIGVDRGDLRSLHNLAFHLQGGLGIEKNVKLAVQYYMRAARSGLAASQNNVGWHYYKGDGIKQSIPDAVFWITRAADQGESFAYGSLCEMYDAGDVFEPNDVEAYKWCRLAVEHEPEGRVRDNDQAILQKFKTKLSQDGFKNAEKLAATWMPLKDAGGHMRNPDDG